MAHCPAEYTAHPAAVCSALHGVLIFPKNALPVDWLTAFEASWRCYRSHLLSAPPSSVV